MWGGGEEGGADALPRPCSRSIWMCAQISKLLSSSHDSVGGAALDTHPIRLHLSSNRTLLTLLAHSPSASFRAFTRLQQQHALVEPMCEWMYLDTQHHIVQFVMASSPPLQQHQQAVVTDFWRMFAHL